MKAEVKAILEYQKLEAELVRIEREIEQNPNNAVKNKMVAVVKDSQVVAQQLEQTAKQSVDEFNKVKKIYDENYKKAEKLNSIDLDKLNDEQLVKLNSELENVLSNLNVIEKRLTALNSGVEQILDKFEKAKQNAYMAKTHYTKAKEELDKVAANFAGARKKIEAEMEKLRPTINKTLLGKYQQKRKENLFPVFTRLTADKRCESCRMELNKMALAKIAADGGHECENCHRVVVSE